jgi:hypothetical protein
MILSMRRCGSHSFERTGDLARTGVGRQTLCFIDDGSPHYGEAIRARCG